MKKIKRNIIRFFYYYVYRNNVKCAKRLGVRIGNDCKILDESGAVFGTEPWLITIGNHVEITHGVRFLTHEGAMWVVRGSSSKYKDVDVFSPIVVGNNVMIGMNSLIMPGVRIGDNVIIGAHSVVTKNVPDNTIVAGVPEKKISTISEYINKLEKNELKVNTKKMSQEQKKKVLKNKFPNWFN